MSNTVTRAAFSRQSWPRALHNGRTGPLKHRSPAAAIRRRVRQTFRIFLAWALSREGCGSLHAQTSANDPAAAAESTVDVDVDGGGIIRPLLLLLGNAASHLLGNTASHRSGRRGDVTGFAPTNLLLPRKHTSSTSHRSSM